MAVQKIFLLEDYLRGSSPLPSLPLVPPPSISSPLDPSSLSPSLLTSLSSSLLSSPSLNSLPTLINSLSSLITLPSPPFPSHLSLLLGSISLLTNSTSHFTLLASLFENHISLIAADKEFLPEALAGLGYALSRVNHISPFFKQFISFLFSVWHYGENWSLENGIMVFKLIDWLVSGFIGSNLVAKIQTFCFEITDMDKWVNNKFSDFAILMANCGALRALKIATFKYSFQFDPKIQNLVENSVSFFAKSSINYDNGHTNRTLLIKCIAFGLAKIGKFDSDPNVVKCLCEALLNDIFPLKALTEASIINPNEDFIITKLKEHMNSILFKEAGAITGVLCNQYTISKEETKRFIETLIWDYSNELYMQLKKAILFHKNKRNNVLNELEKISEAAFLMVVVISNEISKYRLNPKPNPNPKFWNEVSIKILVAFSCIEYLRRVRLNEYTDSVRRAIIVIQEDLGSCVQFVHSMPCYDEITGKLDLEYIKGQQYDWSKDDVQTARILFYLRVLPTCVNLIPVSIFAKKVVPAMFLYMKHPNEKVTRASHSVLVSFLNSFNENDENERVDLKEKISFYYVQTALEGYPSVTPFDGLASGVAALVRNLPAGSPGTFYCTHSLVSKAKILCDEAMKTNLNMWKNWEESSEPCKKVVDLLLRLLSLVDIQVLPYLLRELAGFISELPMDGQDALLSDMYGHVAESDDVTRKPVLVSWLQSLSYLSSQTSKNSAQITSCL